MKDHRRCVSCRRVAPKSAFWRIVRCHPDRQIQLDQGMGRSVYLCPASACLKSAQKKDRLSRALKVKVEPSVYHRLEQRLGANDDHRMGGDDRAIPGPDCQSGREGVAGID
jgi:uncharacterized protein